MDQDDGRYDVLKRHAPQFAAAAKAAKEAEALELFLGTDAYRELCRQSAADMSEESKQRLRNAYFTEGNQDWAPIIENQIPCTDTYEGH